MATIWGVVLSDGKIAAGTGYNVIKDADAGLYDITFDKPFAGQPAVLATQLYPNQSNSNGGNTKDNAVVVYVNNKYCRIVTGDSNGNRVDRDFSFLVIAD